MINQSIISEKNITAPDEYCRLVLCPGKTFENMGLVGVIIICAVMGLSRSTPFGSTSLHNFSLVKTPGETVLFSTYWHQAPFTSISWEVLNITIINSTSTGPNFTNPEYADRITLFSDGSLELRNITLGDSGSYTVTITPAEPPLIEKLFLLNVFEPVSDVRVSASATDLIEDINSVNFTCTASGSRVRFSWYNHSYSLHSQTPVLTLTSVTRYDTGPFRCEAYNLISRGTSQEVSLTISYGPEVFLKTVPSQDYYLEGSNVKLLCLVESRPEAEITWFFMEVMLPVTGAELVLRDLTSKHRGYYYCLAFNRKTMLHARSKPEYINVVVWRPDEGGFQLPDRIIVGIAIIAISGFGTAAGYAFLHKQKKMIARARRARLTVQ